MIQAPVHNPQTKLRLGFVGGLDFGPNYDSASFIIDEVAPLLIEMSGGIEIVIGGRKPPQSLIDRAAKFPFIKIVGYVDDIDLFWRNLDAFLIPHITGSGVRTKLLESLARRIPTLTNPAGFDRISPELSAVPYLHVLKSPEDWATLIKSGTLRNERDSSLALPFPTQLLGKNTMGFWKD
ncbi:MAG: glycosyltransferase [Proteobacteria bacterium]|nr:MAG: glycosyltransferase [Pseudomonadota bacterium]